MKATCVGGSGSRSIQSTDRISRLIGLDNKTAAVYRLSTIGILVAGTQSKASDDGQSKSES